MDVIIIALVVMLPAVIGGLLLSRRRPRWSRLRVALVSAVPIPALLLAFCLYVLIDAATASAEKCGVDACAMAMVSAIYFGLSVLLGLVLSILVTGIMLSMGRR